jgi:hypothetical protein
VNVLENIVYELKQMCEVMERSSHSVHVPEPVAPRTPTRDSPSPSPRYPPAPPSIADEDEDEDLLHETLQNEIEFEQMPSDAPLPEEVAMDQPFFPEEEENAAPVMESAVAADTNDLQPGGVGSGVVSEISSFDSMTVKELRRLALQRGISGASDMPKKKLIAAIRATPTDAFSLDAHL